MSPHGSITVIYRAEVLVPQDVHDAFYLSTKYGYFATRVVAGAIRSGGEHYDLLPTEWAEFYVKRDAEDFINNWHRQILYWQEELRSQP